MALAGWFEGRVPDQEDLEAAGDLTIEELLFHLFGPEAKSDSTLSAPQETRQEAQDAIYGLSGTVDGPGPSQAALEAFSAHGVTGAVHYRTLEDDTVFTLDGDGGIEETEEAFL